MRRTDRLFEIMQLFRGGRLLKGSDIARQLEVSLRTIYRDIDTLVASGIPIEGERGVGYILREPIFLPPLTLKTSELEALHLGMEIVRQTSDNQLASSAKKLMQKIDAVLPSDRQGRDYLGKLSVYTELENDALRFLAVIRKAIAELIVLEIKYTRLDDVETSRHIRPLHVEYWGKAWTCTAWCELKNDFRVFRIDRISVCVETEITFQNEAGKLFSDYLALLNLDGVSH